MTNRRPTIVTAQAAEKYPDNNPKSAFGIKKASLHCVPMSALFELGAAMEFGAYRANGPGYGLTNWRGDGVTVAASVYFDAGMRHRLAWWDSREDMAPDSLVHHLAHSMACDAIVIDAIATGNLKDDRPGVAGAAVKTMRAIAERKAALFVPLKK